jgi:hypothetical protein
MEINWLWVSGIASFLQTIWGAYVSLQKDWAQEHKRIVFAGVVVLGGVGVSAIAIQSGKSAEASARLQSALHDLSASSTQIQVSSQETARIQSENTKLQERLLEQSGIISELARRGINTALGGDSFCYMTFEGASLTEGNATPVIVHVGKYPLYDTAARVTDMVRFNAILAQHGIAAGGGQTLGYRAVLPAMRTIQIGSLAAGSSGVLSGQTIPFSDRDSQDFTVEFSARNGFWTECLKLIRVRGEWTVAYRVVSRAKHGKTLLTFADKQFPMPVGNIKW